MSDASFDAILRAAVAEAAEAQAAALTAAAAELPEHQFSRRFQRRMARLLKEPLRYARPAWQQALRTAAMILVTLGLTGTVLLSIPQVRAAVWNFIRTVFDTHTEYRFTEPAPEEAAQLPTYHANWLPEGYEETMVQNTGDSVWIEYKKNNAVIHFSYEFAQQGLVFSVDNEHTTESTLMHNDTIYTVYFNEKTGWRGVTWFSADGDIFYQLDGPCTTEELLKIKDNLS